MTKSIQIFPNNDLHRWRDWTVLFSKRFNSDTVTPRMFAVIWGVQVNNWEEKWSNTLLHCNALRWTTECSQQQLKIPPKQTKPIEPTEAHIIQIAHVSHRINVIGQYEFHSPRQATTGCNLFPANKVENSLKEMPKLLSRIYRTNDTRRTTKKEPRNKV